MEYWSAGIRGKIKTEVIKTTCLAYKLENGLLRLVESLEQKRNHGDWIDHLTVKEDDSICGQN